MKHVAFVLALLYLSPAIAGEKHGGRSEASPNWRTEIPFPRHDWRSPDGYYDSRGHYRLDDCRTCGDEEEYGEP